jgi:hypothetical protein
MADRVIKCDFVADDTIRVPGRLRTAKEASHLLEQLRNAYQSLTLEEQREVRSFMSDLLESQRRFGSTVRDQWD